MLLLSSLFLMAAPQRPPPHFLFSVHLLPFIIVQVCHNASLAFTSSPHALNVSSLKVEVSCVLFAAVSPVPWHMGWLCQSWSLEFVQAGQGDGLGI